MGQHKTEWTVSSSNPKLKDRPVFPFQPDAHVIYDPQQFQYPRKMKRWQAISSPRDAGSSVGSALRHRQVHSCPTHNHSRLSQRWEPGVDSVGAEAQTVLPEGRSWIAVTSYTKQRDCDALGKDSAHKHDPGVTVTLSPHQSCPAVRSVSSTRVSCTQTPHYPDKAKSEESTMQQHKDHLVTSTCSCPRQGPVCSLSSVKPGDTWLFGTRFTTITQMQRRHHTNQILHPTLTHTFHSHRQSEMQVLQPKSYKQSAHQTPALTSPPARAVCKPPHTT